MPARPSYRSGFAPETGQPRYPELWRGRAGSWCPSLGQSGQSLKDHSGMKRHATVSGTLSSMWASRYGLQALRFNGTSDYAQVEDYGRINPATHCGGSCWVYLTSVTGIQSFYRKGWTVGVNFQYAFRANGTQIQAVVSNASGTVATASTTTTIAVNTPYFAAWSYDGASVSIYLNGRLEAQSALTGDIFSSTQPLVMGASYDTSGLAYTHFLTGDLDDLSIYNRVLTASEVRLLASRRGIAYEPEPRRYGKSAAAAALRKRYLTLLGVGN